MTSESDKYYSRVPKMIEPISLADIEKKVILTRIYRAFFLEKILTSTYGRHQKVPKWKQNCETAETCASPQVCETIFDFPLSTFQDETSEVCEAY